MYNYDFLLDKEEFESFSKMCEKAQMMIFNYLLTNGGEYSLIENDWFRYELTPIEQIFYIAYKIITHTTNYEDKLNGVSMFIVFQEEMYLQSEIQCKDKKYRVDFEFSLVKRNYNLKNELKYIIELDGYEYHSNKQQMEYDYERENNLKELGYNVIRFTGSQIYKNPFDCAIKVINIIMKDIKKEKSYEC